MQDKNLLSPEVRRIINYLNLSPHPEGGYFCETYRSEGKIRKESLPSEIQAEGRSFATAIYFLLTQGSISHFHRVKSDEIWHFYDGSPICLHLISESGTHTEHIIGRNIEKGEAPQFIVPGGYWFAAEVIIEDSFSLVGCTVSPGFDFKDFELKTRKELVSIFPDKEEIISKLTHN